MESIMKRNIFTACVLCIFAGACFSTGEEGDAPVDGDAPAQDGADVFRDGQDDGPGDPWDLHEIAPDGPGDAAEDLQDGGVDDGPRPEGIVLGLTNRSFTFDGVETFVLAVSYYGGVAAPADIVASDIGRLAPLGFNNMRVWVTWTSPSIESSVVRSDGTLDAGALSRLRLLIETARDHGMTVDVTFSMGMEGSSDGGFDNYLAAMVLLTNELAAYRNIFFDLGNERDVGDSRFISVDDVARLAAAVRATDPGRLVTASGGGSTGEAAGASYVELYSAADLDFATPHFSRDAGWAAATEERVGTMRTVLLEAGWDRPIYLQEEARNGYGGAEWPKSDFLTAVAGAARAGAAGWCFHTDAGFDLQATSFFDQLDPIEQDTIDELAAAGG
jgi:hypothetical protein